MTMTIKKGITYTRVLRPTSKPWIYQEITAIANTAPVRITAPAHGLVSGQYAAVVSVKGMREINTDVNRKGEPKEYKRVTVIDADTIEINEINASCYSPYQSGGQLQFLTPTDMSGCVVRRSIKDKEGGTELLRLTTENGGITIDHTNHTLTETIDAMTTESLTWTAGVTDMKLIFTATGVVIELLPMENDDHKHESVIVLDEITT